MEPNVGKSNTKVRIVFISMKIGKWTTMGRQ